MRCHIVFALAFLSICVTSRKIRGISLSYKRFYRERKSFLCIDGSKMIPFEQVNDDYCDCEDGSDEPGTAACANGRFYCTNLGFRPHYLPSSRVNDGICDCCDASDEYDSHTRCQNSCRNLGQRERAEMEGQRKTLDEGLRLKEQLIEEGALVWREKQAQLRDLLRVSAELQVKLEENKRRRPDAPIVAEDSSRSLNWTATGIFLKLDCNKDGRVTAEEVRSEVVLVREEERGVSSDEAVALLGGAQQVSLAAFQQTLWDSLRTGDRVKIRGTRGAPGSPADEDPDIKAAEGTDDGDAADLKNVALAAETVHMEIRDLREKLALDYGPEREFLILSSQCYQLKVYGYTYTLCPFNQVTQKSAAGTQVSLGKWGTWLGSPNNRYNLMKYENGQPCWQGPARNTVVTLTCGMETALRSVKEPSKCQYVMEFESPVACQPAPRQQDGHSEL